jgi:hypothetical protein
MGFADMTQAPFVEIKNLEITLSISKFNEVVTLNTGLHNL